MHFSMSGRRGSLSLAWVTPQLIERRIAAWKSFGFSARSSQSSPSPKGYAIRDLPRPRCV